MKMWYMFVFEVLLLKTMKKERAVFNFFVIVRLKEYGRGIFFYFNHDLTV